MTSSAPALRPSASHRGADLALAVAAAAVQVGTVLAATHHQVVHRPLDAGAILLLVAGPLSLVERRRRPATVLAATFATTAVYTLADYPHGFVYLALIIACVTAVMEGRRLAAWTSILAGYLAFIWLGAILGRGSMPGWGTAAGVGAWLLVLIAAGEILKVRRERALAAMSMREQEALRRAGEERLRIAREVHDVLAHNISLISVQAGVALHLIDEHPEQARTALAAIKQASKDALSEVRSVLGVLQQDGGAAPRSPAPGLARLDELISGARSAGLAVHTVVEGTPRPLAAAADLAAFRVVQEALTNVRRHSGAGSATVTITYAEAELAVQVDDDGRGPESRRPSEGGLGIRGMRERAAALGGRVDAGPRPGGGFRVVARLPLEGRT